MSNPRHRLDCSLAPRGDRGREGRRHTRGATAALLVAAWAVACLWVGPAHAQPLGVQDRADAASRMILLGVAQGINSLPPASAQSFSYEYDAQLDTFVPSAQLGPAVFRSPRAIGPGQLSLRVASSYFELYGDMGTIPYRVTGFPGEPELFTRLGLEVGAKVGLITSPWATA